MCPGVRHKCRDRCAYTQVDVEKVLKLCATSARGPRGITAFNVRWHPNKSFIALGRYLCGPPRSLSSEAAASAFVFALTVLSRRAYSARPATAWAYSPA